MKKNNKSTIICRCNNVPLSEIEKAISGGCKTMNEIFDMTSAGVGPCGGTCRRVIVPILEEYLKTGVLPSAKTHPSTREKK